MQAPLHAFTPVIVVHAAAALAALGLGGWLLMGRKGSASHRVAGRLWAALMAVTALSTWWIRTDGRFSVIHLLSVFTLAMLVLAVRAARTGNVRRHRRIMGNLYAGALVVAGLFTLLPSRLLGWHLWHGLGLV